ncbi:MAG TPA: 50S ribosomal protein L25/general stress protein Ctc [Protaetiibacter sp.]|nr:50S ribosomal protein L25/general stress protein Ctc [Protaetiibacter sp.]
MSDENKLVAEIRDQFGKGAARRIRATGKIPAVIYGHGSEPQHVTLPGHEVSLILRRANAVLDLDIAGKNQLALVKDVQKDPVRQVIEHIDLIVVKKGEKVQVEVPVHVVGEPAPGTALEQEAHTLLVEAPALAIPDAIQISVEGVEAVTHLTAESVELPADTTLISDPETLVVSVVLPVVVAEPEAEEEPAAAAAPAEAAEQAAE